MNKYLKCAGVAATTDLITGAINYFFLEKPRKIEHFFGAFFGGVLFGSIPAAFANVIDSYVNPHITDNKYLQYGLTALESGLTVFNVTIVIDIIINCFSSEDPNTTQDFIKGLFSWNLKNEKIYSQTLFLGAILQGVAFKYLLSEEES